MSEQDRLGEVDRILSGRANGAAKQEAKGAGVEVDDIVELPEPGSPYQAFARPSQKPLYTINFDLGVKGWFGFQYVQLDSHSEFQRVEKGQLLRLRFAGTKIWDAEVEGINLFRGYDLICQHRMAWIRLSDNGFGTGKKDDPVVTAIRIKEIEREA